MTIKNIGTLSSGVKVYDLNELVGNDFQQADEIFSNGDYTGSIHAENHYSDRVENHFVGTYEVQIDSTKEYHRFMDLILGVYPFEHRITFENWKENKIMIGNRCMRLTKYLKRYDVSDYVLDVYSAQIKTGLDTWFLTITDRVQHIAGMTYNKRGSWSSCQHPDSLQSVHLAGSLHDSKLLIGMLHKNLEDVEDMYSCLYARTNMRIVHIDGVQHLFCDRQYGTVESKEILDRCLQKLEELHIHSLDIRDYRWGIDEMRVQEEQETGSTYVYLRDEVLICDNICEDVSIECPMCNGSGEYEVWSDLLDKDVEVCCPMCGGSGDYEVRVDVEIEEYIEVEDEAEILTYADNYHVSESYVSFNISKSKFEKHIEKYPN